MSLLCVKTENSVKVCVRMVDYMFSQTKKRLTFLGFKSPVLSLNLINLRAVIIGGNDQTCVILEAIVLDHKCPLEMIN